MKKGGDHTPYKDEFQLAALLADFGGRLFRVGGCVRDELLGREHHDRDYVVVGLSATDFETVVPEAFACGKAFHVYRLQIAKQWIEVALARTESKAGYGHLGFSVTSNRDVKLIDDLRRRDFTINAMAQDVLTGEIYDPYGGRDDLKRGILKAVSHAFKEDPLRVYRAARLESQLNFATDGGTRNKMKEILGEIGSLSVERVYEEVNRALQSRNPTRFFTMLHSIGALDYHFPELADLFADTTAFERTMNVLAACAQTTQDTPLRFAALVQGLSEEAVREFCTRLKLPGKWLKAGVCITTCKVSLEVMDLQTVRQLVEALFFAKRTPLGIRGYCTLCRQIGEVYQLPKTEIFNVLPAVFGEVIKDVSVDSEAKERGGAFIRERLHTVYAQRLFELLSRFL